MLRGFAPRGRPRWLDGVESAPAGLKDEDAKRPVDGERACALKIYPILPGRLGRLRFRRFRLGRCDRRVHPFEDGQLTAEEQVELESMVRANTLLGVLKAQAHAFLADGQPS